MNNITQFGILSLAFILMLSASVIAGGLEVTDIDVKITNRDGTSKTDKNLKDGDKIDEEAEPGSKIEFEIEVFNNFTDDEDLEIENVEITITIEGIDDGDDLDEESGEEDISADDDETFTIEFELPLEVDDDTFDVEIKVEGEDENGTDHEVTVKLELEVEKERHQLLFTRVSLSPESVECNRFGRLDVGVMNIGRDDEDDVQLEITSPDLSIDERRNFDLEEDPFDSDSKAFHTFTFSVGEDVRQGSYPIQVQANYDGGNEVLDDQVFLQVRNCGDFEEEPEEEEEEPEVVVIETPVEQPPVVQQPITPPITVIPEEPEAESFLESASGTVSLIALYAIVIILIVGLIIWMLRR